MENKDNLNDKLKKISKYHDDFSKSLDDILPTLEKIKENLKKVNDMTGATKRAKDIRDEIKLKGWATIEKIYNPENNKHESASEQLFALYKFIYEDMVKKGEIDSK